jgi:hypothetical protein
MFLGSLGFVLGLLGPGNSAPPPRPAPTRGGLSWTESDSLVRKLQAIESRQKAQGKRETVLVTEGELNSYLNLELAPKLPRGVSDLLVRLDRDRVFASGTVDLDQVQGKLSSSRFSPLALLSGRVPVQIQGRLMNLNGFGAIEWEDIRISSLSLPASVLGQLVASSTRDAENPEGFDIQAPFRLPHACQRLRLEPGRALLDFDTRRPK